MKISHEFPISFMERGRHLIDYDFVLPHLLDRDERYLKYFLKSKQEGRYMIMDNSLHELKDETGGKPYDADRLWHWMNELEPDEFIVPDYWMDKTTTLVAAKDWIQRDYPEKTTPVAVVQAQNKTEAYECYSILKMQGYEKIAFSYGADWYADEGNQNDPNVFKRKAEGRYNVIKEFYDKGLIKDSDRIHLLGANLPQEFSYYKDMPFIETIDTSNPVIHGLAGIKYASYGLLDKLSTKVDKFEGDGTHWDLVLYNIEKFRELCK